MNTLHSMEILTRKHSHNRNTDHLTRSGVRRDSRDIVEDAGKMHKFLQRSLMDRSCRHKQSVAG